MKESAFLEGIKLRKVHLPENSPFKPIGLALGQGGQALEVLVTTSNTEPGLPVLRAAWKARNAGRAAPLLFIVLYGQKGALCGPSGDDPVAHTNLDPGQVDRICREALIEPDRHAALRALRDSIPAVKSEMAGIRNEGFLASHELVKGARLRSDWGEAAEKAGNILTRRGEDVFPSLFLYCLDTINESRNNR